MNNERKVALGIRLSYIVEAKNLGYEDINDYIDALKLQIDKLTKAKDYITQELQKTNTKIEELENAAKKEA